MDDDLKLNHVPEPRARGGKARFLVLAVAIAAGLHLLVFGVLALSAHKNPPAAKPTITAAPVSAPSAPAAAVPAAAEAAAASTSSAATTPDLRPPPVVSPPPARHVRPAKPVTSPHGHAAMVRRAHAPRPKTTPAPARKVKTPKPQPKRATVHKPARTLDLDALSKFKPSGK